MVQLINTVLSPFDLPLNGKETDQSEHIFMVNSAVYSARLPRVLGMLSQSFSRVHTVYHRFSKIFVAGDINMSFISLLLSVYIAFLFHLLTIHSTYENVDSRLFPVYRNKLKRHDLSTFVGRMFSTFPPSI